MTNEASIRLPNGKNRLRKDVLRRTIPGPDLFRLGDPYALEGTNRTKDISSNPNRVLAFGWIGDLDVAWGEGYQSFMYLTRDTGRNSGAT